MTSRGSVVIAVTVSAALLVSLIGVEYAAAQGAFVPLAETPGGSRLGNLYQSANLGDFINRLFTAALSLGAILAVLRLAFAGYMYMTTDAWGQKGKAKEIIGNVVLGLLLLLSIWLILRQINPQLLDLNILKYLPNLPAQQQTNAPTQPQAPIQQQFTAAPQNNSFFGGANSFDSSINGVGVGQF